MSAIPALRKQRRGGMGALDQGVRFLSDFKKKKKKAKSTPFLGSFVDVVPP